MVADEANIQHEPNGANRWSEIGHTPIIKVNRNRDKNHRVSVFGALSITTGKVITFFCGWLNSDTAVQFLNRVKAYRKRLLKARKGGPLPILLIWDGAKYHKGLNVRLWLALNPGVVELMNFPPYCPECNPQEHVWKAMKQYLATLRTSTVTFGELTGHARKFLKKRFDYRLL